MTHNKDVNEDITTYPEWAIHVEEEVLIWKKWNDYWLQKARDKEALVYFFRFEDLLSDPVPVMKSIFAVALGIRPE